MKYFASQNVKYLPCGQMLRKKAEETQFLPLLFMLFAKRQKAFLLRKRTAHPLASFRSSDELLRGGASESRKNSAEFLRLMFAPNFPF
jgi:hypothetical protein